MRIDQPPSPSAFGSEGPSALKEVLRNNRVRAVLQVQSTEPATGGVFVTIRSAVALAGNANWNELAVRSALASFVQPNLTTRVLGMGWRQVNGYYELDGLQILRAAVRGKYLIVSDDAALISGMLANLNRKLDVKPAVFVAGFDHQRERKNLFRLAAAVDHPDIDRPDVDRAYMVPPGGQGADRTSQFFSANVASLSSALAAVSSERIVVRVADDKMLQTVTYKWTQ
jgi:hypothetical protein